MGTIYFFNTSEQCSLFLLLFNPILKVYCTVKNKKTVKYLSVNLLLYYNQMT